MEAKIIEAIKARETLIFLETMEEDEAISILKNVALTLNQSLIQWDAASYYKDITPDGAKKPLPPMEQNLNQLIRMFDEISKYSDDAIFVIKDAKFYINDRVDTTMLATFVRRLKDLKLKLKNTGKTVIIIGSCYNLTNDLNDDFALLTCERPDKQKLEEIYLDFLANNDLARYATDNTDVKDEIVTAAKGLTADQFRSCIAKSYVKYGKIDATTVDLILETKKQIISKSGIVEYIEEDVSFNNVGGLTLLKDWLKKRQLGFSKKAKEAALPEPKGIMVFGIPGTGKSLTAKAVSALWRRPILRMDMSRIFGRFVGESENNMREVLRLADAVAPCILWIDEIEKAFAGASGGHETTVRVFGSLLTWMQEKKSSVFVIATANDISNLPSEFLRKGRFDEIFFIDVPSLEERKEIFQIQLKKYKLNPNDFDINMLAQISQKFTGAEIEQAIIEAKYNAFYENQPVTDAHLRNAIREIRPIYYNFQKKLEDSSYQQIIQNSKRASIKEEE